MKPISAILLFVLVGCSDNHPDGGSTVDSSFANGIQDSQDTNSNDVADVDLDVDAGTFDSADLGSTDLGVDADSFDSSTQNDASEPCTAEAMSGGGHLLISSEEELFQQRCLRSFSGVIEFVGIEADISLPSLQHVFDGGILINGTAASRISFPQLRTPQQFRMTHNSNLETVELPMLTETDRITSTNNPMLTELNLPEWRYGIGESWFSENERLISLKFPKLVEIRELTISSNPALENIEMGAIQRYYVTVEDNPNYPSCLLDDLSETGVILTEQGNGDQTCNP